MTTFLFASVLVSGIRIMNSGEGGIGRRERFILAVALGAGLGVTIIPQWTQNNLWPVTDGMSDTVKGFRDAVIITLSTGYRRAPPTALVPLPTLARLLQFCTPSMTVTVP